MARFYGWTDETIGSMEAIVFNKYFKAIEPLQCEETLLSINSSVFPHMKDDRRKSFFRDLKNRITTSIDRNMPLKSYEEVRTNLLRAVRRGR